MAMDSMSTSPAGLSYHTASDFYPRKLGPKPDVVPSGVTERKVGAVDKPDMVSVDVINFKDSDTPVHRKKQETDTYVLGTIHPFRKSHRSILGKFFQEFKLVTSDHRSWKILLFGALNVICTACLLMWCNSTNSMAYFNLFLLFFSSCRGRLLVGTFVALFFNLLTLLSVKNKPFVYVSEAASTSWLQEHVADLSRSLCGIIPALSSFLLPRMNPFVLINLAGAFALGITYMLIEINNYNAVDTASAVAIALMTFGTMYPMSVYSGKVLLQTTPSHVIGQLDKLLREVSTLDGVLEVRNEHFWTIGFGSLAGSVHVRIRRDANEQMVLAHVTNRLHTLVSTLTVQIFKDDWTRPSLATGALPAGTVGLSDYGVSSGFLPPSLAKQAEELDPLTSTPTKPSSPPPEFSFNTPGRNIQPVVLPSAHQHHHQHQHHLHHQHHLGVGPYGASPYASMLNQGGFAQPGIGGVVGARLPSVQGYRTSFSAAPHRYASNLMPSQMNQYRP
uniref:Solute carrier family 30 member 6 n=1 Tax=Astyanax mexicanus TaxID=7994 RepID=A0A8B9JLC8_ASTMX